MVESFLSWIPLHLLWILLESRPKLLVLLRTVEVELLLIKFTKGSKLKKDLITGDIGSGYK